MSIYIYTYRQYELLNEVEAFSSNYPSYCFNIAWWWPKFLAEKYRVCVCCGVCVCVCVCVVCVFACGVCVYVCVE